MPTKAQYYKILQKVLWEKCKGELNALSYVSETLNIPIQDFITKINYLIEDENNAKKSTQSTKQVSKKEGPHRKG